MARYIDADKFTERIKVSPAFRNINDGLLLQRIVIDLLNNMPTVDVAPKSEEGAECPTCHGTGRIGTTNWLVQNVTKKQIAEEKAKAIAEHEQHIKAEVAREIFAEIDKKVKASIVIYLEEINKEHIKDTPLYDRCSGVIFALRNAEDFLAELKKKYTEEK